MYLCTFSSTRVAVIVAFCNFAIFPNRLCFLIFFVDISPCCYMFRIDCFTPSPREQVRRPFKNIDPSSLSFNVPSPDILHCSCIETLMVLLWIRASPTSLDGVCMILRITGVTDRITWITWITPITLHHLICHHYQVSFILCIC